ncbi:MAG: lactate utilization protein [Bacteroidales bacterium]|nr:lactate utilization protein [Bacteroidales bacterium]
MSRRKKYFIKESAKISFDLKHRKTIRFNIGRYLTAVEQGKTQFSHYQEARTIANNIKNEVLSNFSNMLNQFEKNFTANGGQIIYAATKEDAVAEILKIAKTEKVKTIVKSKSITTEELQLNEVLEEEGYQNYETDLGEFIVQTAGEKPYHIVTPAMHKSKEDIAELFNEKFETPENSSPEYITNFVREFLRKEFQQADLGISGANFLVADKGAISITENEGNALLSTSFPKVHIAIAGIEKLLPRMTDLGLLLPLLATNGTGQLISAYNTMIFGPRRNDETDGPEKVFLILLDNGRTDLYNKKYLNLSLACIRCGACLNVCPIYQNIGGYTYETPYAGPIGSIISPHFEGFEEFNHLSFASTLCGKCAEVCPVKIPLTDLLLYNRDLAVRTTKTDKVWDIGINTMTNYLLSRKKLDKFSGSFKNIFAQSLLKNRLGKKKSFPRFAKNSFSSSVKQQENVK